LQAEIVLRYTNLSTAKAVAEAVSPDNFETPSGLTVRTTQKQREVITEVKCKEKLGTFIATIDDLLSSASIAERTLHATVEASKKTMSQQAKHEKKPERLPRG
jgi:mevalonate kinase